MKSEMKYKKHLKTCLKCIAIIFCVLLAIALQFAFGGKYYDSDVLCINQNVFKSEEEFYLV